MCEGLATLRQPFVQQTVDPRLHVAPERPRTDPPAAAPLPPASARLSVQASSASSDLNILVSCGHSVDFIGSLCHPSKATICALQERTVYEARGSRLHGVTRGSVAGEN